MTVLSLLITTASLVASKGRLAYRRRPLRRRSFKGSEGVKRLLRAGPKRKIPEQS